MKHRAALIACLSAHLLSGCVAILPVVDYIASSPSGTVKRSTYCLGHENMVQAVGEVTLISGVRRDGASPSLNLAISVPPDHIARLPGGAIRVRSLDGGTALMKPVGQWRQQGLRPHDRQFKLEEIEHVAGNGYLVGGLSSDGDSHQPHSGSKTFSTRLTLDELPAEDYVVDLPDLEVNGKPANLPPITFTRRVRVEFMVPFNC